MHIFCVQEIEEEIAANGGRVNLVELGPTLDVDTSHIQDTVNHLLGSNSSMTLLNGQIISSAYLDGVVEEINQALEDSGQLSLVDVAQRFSLPANFMKTALVDRADTILRGQLKDNNLYTSSFVERHRCRVRGCFAGVTRPTPVRHMVSLHGLLEDLTYTQLKNLVDAKALPGTLKGSKERSSYVPAIFSAGQVAAVTSFFAQNGYILYSKLKKLEIAQPKSFLKEQFADGVELKTCWLSGMHASTLTASLEEAVANNTWLEPTALLPSPLTSEDVDILVEKSLKSYKDQVLKMGSYAVTHKFMDRCREAMKPVMEKAAEAFKAAAKDSARRGGTQAEDEHLSSTSQSLKDNDTSTMDSDSDEDTGKKGKRKGKGNKVGKRRGDSDDEEEEVTLSSRDAKKLARQARATAGKGGGRGDIGGGKKKKGKKTVEEEPEEEEPVIAGGKGKKGKSSKEANSSKKSSSSSSNADNARLSIRQTLEGLRSALDGEDVPDDLMDLVASSINSSIQSECTYSTANTKTWQIATMTFRDSRPPCKAASSGCMSFSTRTMQTNTFRCPHITSTSFSPRNGSIAHGWR